MGKYTGFSRKKKYSRSPRQIDLRQILNGISFLVRTGCQWRNANEKYEKMATLYEYFSKWKKDQNLDKI